MRIIIAGTRDFDDYQLLERKCKEILESLCTCCDDFKEHFEIVSGCAKGADTLGEAFAHRYKIPVKKCPAQWDNITEPPVFIKTGPRGNKYNALAGKVRNEQMAIYASQKGFDDGALIAFWDGKSSGTKNMIDLADKYGIQKFIINYKENI
jgi:hypothetical protein